MAIEVVEVEVISSETHKYASTEVSGGGGVISHSPAVPSRVEPIESTTTFYSDQALWLRNVDTGKEFQLKIEDFNIGVRPGHRLLAVLDDDSPRKLERIHNLNTGETSWCAGVLNAGKLVSIVPRILGTTVLTAFVSLPMLNWIGIPAMFVQFALIRHDGWTKWLSWRERLTLMALAAAQIPGEMAAFRSGLGVLLLLILIAAFAGYVFRMQGKANATVRGRADAIDRMLEAEVSRREAALAAA